MGKYDYNIIVIGTGSGELASSYTASVTKAKVALIWKTQNRRRLSKLQYHTARQKRFRLAQD